MKTTQPKNSGDAAVIAGAAHSASPRMAAPPKKFSFLWLWGLGGVIIISGLGAMAWWGSDYLFTTPTPAPRAIAQGGALIKSTLTFTPTFTPTKTPTVTPTFTPTNTPTFTPTFTPTDTPTITPTFTPSLTFTPRPTNTPRPPTNTPAALPTLGLFNGIGGGDVAGRWIDVNLSRQQVVAYDGNTPMATFIVSTGTWQYPTVTGKYNIYVKYVAQTMWGEGYYLPNVPYVMYFYQGYGLHGTYWHNNFGTPMSHGCVNLRTIDAAWLYNFSSIGTLVNVHY